MTLYGLTKSQVEELNQCFEKAFGDDKSAQAYLFGSRATGAHKKYSDIDIAIKSKSSDRQKRLAQLADLLEESNLPQKCDLVDWDRILKDYRPEINKQKRLLWTPQNKWSRWRTCPEGFHWVTRHNRKLKTGKVVDRDGHCRRNPSGKELLRGDEMSFIAGSQEFRNATPKVSDKTLGYPNGSTYDPLITGWTAYWNDHFKLEEPLHPNWVKALIASESGFEVKAKAKNNRRVGEAQGVVQLTEQTQRILRNQKGELKDYLVVLSKEEIFEPSKNICAAVRWLFRKRETAKVKLKREPSWEEVLHEYKGILKQNNKTATGIKERLKKLYEDLE